MTIDRTRIRAARSVLDAIHKSHGAAPPGLDYSIGELVANAERVRASWSLAQTARERRWYAATRDQMDAVRCSLFDVEREVKIALRNVHPVPESLVVPTMHALLDELDSLDQEFDGFKIDLKDRSISVTTGPIELEGIYLGRFKITLSLPALGKHATSEAFELTASDSNPAASDHDVLHPHVRDGRVCAGEALLPIATALSQGRLCDAFMLVRSVLENYNAGSAFISLEDWNGTACYDCGTSMGDGDSCYCDHCGRDFCEQCMGNCSNCEESCCDGCATTCEITQKSCCPRCIGHCTQCRRSVSKDSMDEDHELCSDCLSEQEAQRKEDAAAEAADQAALLHSPNTPIKPQETYQDDLNTPSDDTYEPFTGPQPTHATPAAA